MLLAQGQPGHILSSRLARATLNQPIEQLIDPPRPQTKPTQPSMVAHAIIQALGRYDRMIGVQDHFQQNRVLGKPGVYINPTQKIKQN